MSEAAIERFTSKIRRRMTKRQPDPMATRRKAIESEVGHLTDAIAKGLLSPSLAKRLQHAEAALAALPAPPTVVPFLCCDGGHDLLLSGFLVH